MFVLNFSFGEEERFGSFPFVVDQQFKVAIAIMDHEFRLAINGEYHSTFAYRTYNQLEKLNGLKMGVSHGMQLEITSVDHLTLDKGCEGFDMYSHPDAKIF